MAKRLVPKRIFKAAQAVLQRSSDVQETASCARALTGMVGEVQLSDVLQTAQLTQGVLTAKVIQSQGNIPWPTGISRQLDPEDPAFLPPLGAELPVFARDRTRIGLFDKREHAYVDPWGWFGVQGFPMISVWFADDQDAYCLGKLPLSTTSSTVQQTMTDDGHGVITTQERGKLKLELFHWPVVIADKIAWSMVFRLTALEECNARLALVIAPVEMDGSHPIFNLNRSHKGTWKANGTPIVCVSTIGSSVLHSKHMEDSLWRKFSLSHSSPATDVQIHCSAGQAAGAEVYEQKLIAGESVSHFAIIRPPAGYNLPSISEYSLWRGAVADFQEVLNASSRVQLRHHQYLLDRATQRLLIDHSAVSFAGCMAAVALARLGFTQIAGERLGYWLKSLNLKQAIESDLLSVLIWSCAEFVLWTNERSWLHAHLKLLERSLDLLSQKKTGSGGEIFFGTNGSARWSEVWRVAALLNAVRVLRGKLPDWSRWGLAGASAKERLKSVLGPSPWSASSDESPNGSSAALLAAGWLGLFDIDDPDLRKTEQFIVSSVLHDQGVLLQGGAHIALTALLLALQKRIDPSFDSVSRLARFASETGSFPAVRHRNRGALVDGDSALSASMFVFMVLDDLLVEKGKLRLNGLIEQARELPTPYGKIDIIDGRIVQRLPVEVIYQEE